MATPPPPDLDAILRTVNAYAREHIADADEWTEGEVAQALQAVMAPEEEPAPLGDNPDDDDEAFIRAATAEQPEWYEIGDQLPVGAVRDGESLYEEKRTASAPIFVRGLERAEAETDTCLFYCGEDITEAQFRDGLVGWYGP